MSIELTADHLVPVSLVGGPSATVTVLSGSTVNYSEDGTRNAFGTITNGSALTTTVPIWIWSQGLSAVDVQTTYPGSMSPTTLTLSTNATVSNGAAVVFDTVADGTATISGGGLKVLVAGHYEVAGLLLATGSTAGLQAAIQQNGATVAQSQFGPTATGCAIASRSVTAAVGDVFTLVNTGSASITAFSGQAGTYMYIRRVG